MCRDIAIHGSTNFSGARSRNDIPLCSRLSSAPPFLLLVYPKSFPIGFFSFTVRRFSRVLFVLLQHVLGFDCPGTREYRERNSEASRVLLQAGTLVPDDVVYPAQAIAPGRRRGSMYRATGVKFARALHTKLRNRPGYTTPTTTTILSPADSSIIYHSRLLLVFLLVFLLL